MGNCMFNIKNYLLLTLVVSFSAFNVEVFSQDESADIEEVVTTGSIAVIATASAAATPFLLRVVKPLVKQIINRVKKILGRKTEELSVAQRKEKQRELTAAIRTLKKMKK